MYCRNCGNSIHPNAYACTNCGVPNGVGNRFCPNCGSETDPQAVLCVNCGIALAPYIQGAQQKSKLAAGLLGIFLGGLGVHNFYLGRVGMGVGQILVTIIGTVISCGTLFWAGPLWGLIEGILILAGVIKTDSKGVPLKE